MLVLSRLIGETIVIGDNIRITIMDIKYSRGGSKVRIGIEAPREVPVHRQEVWLEIQEQKGEQK